MDCTAIKYSGGGSFTVKKGTIDELLFLLKTIGIYPQQVSMILCIMDFVSLRGITLILIGRSAIQLICVYDVYLGVPFHSIA